MIDFFDFDYRPENNKPCGLTLENINQMNIRQFESKILTFIRY